ncbi:MAG TPA: CPBP family intramembrane metalloprotease [Aliicoccus persicus]|uniref:CPBP family intramembrane metalloprotease n=1 Tax=Aliicoccus persicus TaxID=930138 RepID=A0A921DVX4_9STAP|nr:CPBP family intramembrane metalloprotease [Aliicoccus persicus]
MRRVYSGIFIVLFIVVQLSSIPFAVYFTYQNPEIGIEELLLKTLPYQVIAYVIATIIYFVLMNRHTNKNRIERGDQTSIGISTVWVIGGVFLAMFAQAIMSFINISLLNQPVESENTSAIMDIIGQAPYMILIVAIFGPIIEEFVFRRAIFGEIYEIMPGPKWVAFFIAATISGLIFGLAHLDFTHMIVYLGMSYTFSFLYVITGRIMVPVLVHMLMNALVITVQMFAPSLEELEGQLQFIRAIIHVVLF